ncbi:MAG: ethanolamine utilization protein EutH [Ruminococcaceae bacterium]|nr:ethanolamine utilization protein EutH [Oscillospiraceae bacterium]
MNYLSIVMSCVSLVAAFDLLIGNKIGIGADFKKGISLLSVMMMSMTGMLILAPSIAHLLQGVVDLLPSFIDPSIVAASLLANDMGGSPLSDELCRNPEIGAFNGMVVSSMMGCTVSFTIPFALGIVPKEHHPDVLFGFLCGVVTIPIGSFVGGIVAGVALLPLIINLIPLILFSALIAVGLIKIPTICLKIFSILGAIINVLIIAGLAAGIFEFLTGTKLIPYSDSIENGTMVCLNATCVMTGTFPLITLFSRLLKKPLTAVAGKLKINQTAAICFVSTLATSAITLPLIKDMDRKGIILNSAFVISGAFVFAGHLAFTMAFNADYIAPMIVGKLVAGITAVFLANIMSKKVLAK